VHWGPFEKQANAPSSNDTKATNMMVYRSFACPQVTPPTRESAASHAIFTRKKQHIRVKKPVFPLEKHVFSITIRTAGGDTVSAGDFSLSSRRKLNHGNCKKSPGKKSCKKSSPRQKSRCEESTGQKSSR
jgi:hypothetical protein